MGNVLCPDYCRVVTVQCVCFEFKWNCSAIVVLHFMVSLWLYLCSNLNYLLFTKMSSHVDISAGIFLFLYLSLVSWYRTPFCRFFVYAGFVIHECMHCLVFIGGGEQFMASLECFAMVQCNPLYI